MPQSNVQNLDAYSTHVTLYQGYFAAVYFRPMKSVGKDSAETIPTCPEKATLSMFMRFGLDVPYLCCQSRVVASRRFAKVRRYSLLHTNFQVSTN